MGEGEVGVSYMQILLNLLMEFNETFTDCTYAPLFSFSENIFWPKLIIAKLGKMKIIQK